MLATEINHGQTKKRVFNALCRENFYAFVKKHLMKHTEANIFTILLQLN